MRPGTLALIAPKTKLPIFTNFNPSTAAQRRTFPFDSGFAISMTLHLARFLAVFAVSPASPENPYRFVVCYSHSVLAVGCNVWTEQSTVASPVPLPES